MRVLFVVCMNYNCGTFVNMYLCVLIFMNGCVHYLHLCVFIIICIGSFIFVCVLLCVRVLVML